MPFIQRIVEPVYVSRGEVDKNIQNELECVTNSSLANIIRQLSSLSQHAEDMFADLNRETMLFFQRASELNSRVEHLTTQVTQLNPTEEEVSLHDINLRKPYQSSKPHDQQVVARITIPKAIQDLYNRCDKPPALEKLNTYREDGKDCMKFYTDPGYFFELWYADIKKDIDNKRKELKQKRDKKGRPHRGGKPKDFTPKGIKSKAQLYKDRAQGIELSDNYKTPDINVGGQKAIPAGYTKHPGHAPAPSEPERQSQNGYPAQQQMSPQAQNHAPNSQISNGPVNVHSHYQQGSPQQQQHMQKQTNPRQSQKGHPAQSPNTNVPGHRQSQRPSIGNNVYASGSSIRMTVAPPPPPPMDPGANIQHADRGSLSPTQRISLPPPPPPPLNESEAGSPQHHTSPHHGMDGHAYQKQQGYHQGFPGQPSLDSSPEDQSLPPPPPPPLTHDSMGVMGVSPGVPSPPPILQTAPAPPPPPPPPPAPMMKAPDTISVSSEASTQSSLASAQIEPPPAPKQTARSALLEEIRLGNRSLRKTEERKREAAPQDRFDVHAVMTKAFDMRRKALEDSESENDEEDEDDWD